MIFEFTLNNNDSQIILSQIFLLQFQNTCSFTICFVISHIISIWFEDIWASMYSRTVSMYSSGGKYLMTFPDGRMKNFAKFQGITLAVSVWGSYSSLFLRRYAKRGWGCSPFTSIFYKSGNSELKLSFT